MLRYFFKKWSALGCLMPARGCLHSIGSDGGGETLRHRGFGRGGRALYLSHRGTDCRSHRCGHRHQRAQRAHGAGYRRRHDGHRGDLSRGERDLGLDQDGGGQV